MSYVGNTPDTLLPWYVKIILWLQRRRCGRELAPSRLWSRTPRVFAALSMLYGALDFAETVTDSRSSAALIGSLRRHFSEDAVVELAALVAFQNMTSKFNESLGVQSQGFCEVRLAQEGKN